MDALAVLLTEMDLFIGVSAVLAEDRRVGGRKSTLAKCENAWIGCDADHKLTTSEHQ